MRHLAALLLAAGSSIAADFHTGQAARAIIGQPTFTAEACANGCDPNLAVEASATIVGAVSGIAYGNGVLLVADANRIGATPVHNRVLIYRNVNQQLPAPGAEVTDETRCPLCVGTADLVLGQPDFKSSNVGLSQSALNLPTAVATDGVHVAVADTNNNRVLIWDHIPQSDNEPATYVIGQPDFTSNCPNSDGKAKSQVPSCTNNGNVPSASSLRGPQGVWFQNGMFFVADEQNHRVLIWKQIPTANFAPADLVLGQPDLRSANAEPENISRQPEPTANSLLSPVSVTSDGTHLFVADLGNNRVLIWNSIPTQNQQAPDVVIGQPDMTHAFANFSGKDGVCPSNGTDSNGDPTFPFLCGATLNWPRFALSDGTRLFVADGGNDRVLIFNQIPTQNGAVADIVLGQFGDEVQQTSDNPDNPDSARRSSSDAIRTPMALAWDGTNLYVTDPSDRRIMVFSMGNTILPVEGIRNAASLNVFAFGTVTLGGTITAKDTVTIKIRDKSYTYTVQTNDTFDNVVSGLVAKINEGEGDQWVLAIGNPALQAVNLTSRVGGLEGNNTTITTEVSANATITAATSSATLTGGQSAAKIAPGALISIFGQNLADETAVTPPGTDFLPKKLAGVSVYIDGMRLPLVAVSPTQINAQMPFEVNDATSASGYVRTEHKDGTVTITTAIGVPVIPANPGIFANEGQDPRVAMAVHGSSSATGTVSIDGTAKAGDTVKVTIGDNPYSYTLTSTDTLETVRDALIGLINASDPLVSASPGGEFTRIRLRAREEGPAGNGIPIAASANEGANIIMNTTNSALCCANIAGAPVTPDNPAIPGEVITVYATGLGTVQPDEAKFAMYTGFTYKGPVINKPNEFVSSLVGGKTANVLYDGMLQGAVGIYEVDLELNSDLPTNPFTQMTIAQDIYVSNIVTIPLVNPNPQ